jgi:hypothetical protein
MVHGPGSQILEIVIVIIIISTETGHVKEALVI